MSNVETLYKTSEEALGLGLQKKILLDRLTSRGYKAANVEEEGLLMQKCAEMSVALLNGDIDPIPAREIEPDGSLSKHASEKAETDFLAFATPCTIDLDKMDPTLVKHATVMAFIALTSAAR